MGADLVRRRMNPSASRLGTPTREHTVIYRTQDGSSVCTTHTDNGTEFETRNADGDVISIRWYPRHQADMLISGLEAGRVAA